jgi:hypothetical protein
MPDTTSSSYSSMVLLPNLTYTKLMTDLEDKDSSSSSSKGMEQAKNQTFNINQLNQNDIKSGAKVNIRGEARTLDGHGNKSMPSKKMSRKVLSRKDFYPDAADGLSEEEDNSDVSTEPSVENSAGFGVEQVPSVDEKDDPFGNPDLDETDSVPTLSDQSRVYNESNVLEKPIPAAAAAAAAAPAAPAAVNAAAAAAAAADVYADWNGEKENNTDESFASKTWNDRATSSRGRMGEEARLKTAEAKAKIVGEEASRTRLPADEDDDEKKKKKRKMKYKVKSASKKSADILKKRAVTILIKKKPSKLEPVRLGVAKKRSAVDDDAPSSKRKKAPAPPPKPIKRKTEKRKHAKEEEEEEEEEETARKASALELKGKRVRVSNYPYREREQTDKGKAAQKGRGRVNYTKWLPKPKY